MRRNRKTFLVWCGVFLSCFLVAVQSGSAYEKEIEGLSNDIAQHMEREGLGTIAVADFTNLQGHITELGRFLASEMSVELAMTAKGFDVIDRMHLNTILQEHKLSMSGLVDPNTVKKLGQIAGVDAIVTGAVTPFGERVRVSCTVIATDTARIVSATRRNIAQTSTIEELLLKGIETGTQTAAPAQRPARRAAPGEPIQSVTARDFVFELKSAEISGNSITFSFLVTNEGDDRGLRIRGSDSRYSNTRIFDNLGNQYRTARARISNYSGRISPWTFVGQQMISGVPTEMSLDFDGVSEEAEMIARLDLTVSIAGNDWTTLGFRNIPLSR